MEPSLDLQTVIHARLINDPTVTALVPAAAILDRHTRPELDCMIIIGEGQHFAADSYATFHERVFLTLHVWVRADDFVLCKTVADAVRRALRGAPWIASGHVVHGATISTRYLREPGGEFAHGVIGIDAVMQELAA